jgi:acyl-CoA synthetase (AMP-forming)/AMP-acid ligase II
MLRYRTGDLVRKAYADDSGALCFDGGIIGRYDDMVCVRGVNVYPSAVDALLRGLLRVADVDHIVEQHAAIGTQGKRTVGRTAVDQTAKGHEPGPGRLAVEQDMGAAFMACSLIEQFV